MGEKEKTRRVKQRNFVAKNARTYNKGGKHRVRTRYERRSKFIDDDLISSTTYGRQETK